MHKKKSAHKKKHHKKNEKELSHAQIKKISGGAYRGHEAQRRFTDDKDVVREPI